MSEGFECPHCGGRLVRGVSTCLHCNEAVTAPPEPTETDATGRFMVIAVVMICLLGAASGIILSFLPEEEQFPADGVTCLPATMGPQIKNLLAQKWKEVEPREGQRCFQQ